MWERISRIARIAEEDSQESTPSLAKRSAPKAMSVKLSHGQTTIVKQMFVN